MGYSMATPMKSEKAKAEMLAFLEEHYRPGHVIAPDLVPHPDMDATVTLGHGLHYDQRKLSIGFNYSLARGFGRHYMINILCWMALKAGRRRRSKWLGIEDRVPCWVYDGQDICPILSKVQAESLDPHMLVPHDMYVADEHGFSPIGRGYPDDYPDQFKTDWDETDRIVKAELIRLSNLWDRRSSPCDANTT